MATAVGSGSSVGSDSRLAAAEATRAALERLGSDGARLGFLFAGPDHDLGAALASARDIAKDADFVACTTAGELTENGLLHGGMAVFLVASEDLWHRVVFSAGMDGEPERVAGNLCAGFKELRKTAFDSALMYSTTVLLTDGLAGTGEETVDRMLEHTDAFHQIAGGAAGDEGRFEVTEVGAATGEGITVGSVAAAGIHVFSSRRWGVGVGHGLRASGPALRITKAEANMVLEIDDRPAFEAYQNHARARGVVLTPENASAYMIRNELGIYRFGEIAKARAPLSLGEDGSLSCAAPISEGSRACILDGEPEQMIAAARMAAEEARESLQGGRAAGILLFDCVCRGMILEDRFQQEIDAVRSVFADVPVAGFLTYGEIACRGKWDHWHNSTAVVLAIPE